MSSYVLKRVSLGLYGLGSIFVIGGVPVIAGFCFLAGTVAAAIDLSREE